jgi:hypothetical protein
MSAPMYVAMGGTIWAREHQPMTLAKARMAPTPPPASPLWNDRLLG